MHTNNTLTQNVDIHLISIIQSKDDKSDGMDFFCSLIVSILCACAVCVVHTRVLLTFFPQRRNTGSRFKGKHFCRKTSNKYMHTVAAAQIQFFFCKLFSDAIVLCGTDNNIRVSECFCDGKKV